MLTRYPEANLNRFLMRFQMEFIVSLKFIYRYWTQVHTKHENLFGISLESEGTQVRE